MKILIDAFGGDNAPKEIVKGAVDAINKQDGFSLILVGKEDVIKEELSAYSFNQERIEILDATEVITNEEEPTLAIRKKADSTIVKGFKRLKEDETVDAFISGGSTGAYLVGATLKLGRIKGVNRPCLCPVLPTINGDQKTLLLDAGANVDCKPENLLQFALMGSIYAEVVLGAKSPRVALLSNGTEDKKGNAVNHEVFSLLKESKDLNFIGNIEARDILFGVADVIVADGFMGNIALKSMEGSIKALMTILKSEVFSSFGGKIAGLFIKDKFAVVKDKMDYNKKGGALFLGVEKLVVKIHGSSKADAVTNAILSTIPVIESKTVERIKEKMQKLNDETAE